MDEMGVLPSESLQPSKTLGMVCDDKIGKFYTQVFLPVFFQLDLPVSASLSFVLSVAFFPQETQKQKDDSCPGSRFEVLPILTG